MKPVNLVPQDQRRRTPSEGSGKGAHVVLGGLAVLLAMAVFYVLTANSVTERKSEASQARAEADRLEAKATQTTRFSDFEQIAQTRVASVAGVAATRFDWERFMRELALVIPEGTWVHSAGAGVTGGEADGPSAATTAATGTTTAAGPSATLSGCTTRHSDVARMMVRLRQLHRVTDVNLTSSTKGAEAGAPAIDSCGANTAFDVTVTFSPTAPAAEAPRGTVRVPVSLGGGS
jgi:Tfp pilus assembly protein PilN